MTEGIKASRVSKSRPPPPPSPLPQDPTLVTHCRYCDLFSWSTWYFIIVTHITRGLHLVANIILNFHVLKNQQRNSFLCFGAKAWNSLPSQACNLPKLAFKKSIRNALFAALEGEDYIEASNLLSKINLYILHNIL